MFVIENTNEYQKYLKDLNEAVLKGNVRYFMEQNKFFGIKLIQKSKNTPSCSNLSTPYYDEICVESVKSWNSPDSTIKLDNWNRVVDAVDYILNDKCMPIAVIKLSNDEYYIENGKHRFYAHLLLQKKKIPVSVRYDIQKSKLKENMINYNIPFYDCDGMEIAYPEKIEEFIDKYIKMENQIRLLKKKVAEVTKSMEWFKTNPNSNIPDSIIEQLQQPLNRLYDLDLEIKYLYEDFSSINIDVKSVKMKKIDDHRQVLDIKMSNNENIIINGACSSGNRTRASQCTCNILNKLGFRVDMTYIANHLEFELFDKRDAHNMNFDTVFDEDIITNEVLPNIAKKIEFIDNEELKKDFFKLMDYISLHKSFETPVTHFSCYSSSFIQSKSNVYYLVGAENKDCVDSIYIFKSNKVPFDNLTVTFLGQIKSDTKLYKSLRFDRKI